MAITRLAIPAGITPPKVINVPDQWSSAWFRSFIKIWLQSQDVGNLNPANPTSLVGLAAVNGTASTYMRSDAAPPLDVSISPTWTGDHTFSPSSGTALTVNAVAGQHGLVISGGNNVSANSFAAVIQGGTGTTGHQSGLAIVAGTNASDASLTCSNSANTATFFQILGNGQISGRGAQAGALVDMAPDEATFTGTLTGVSSGGTGTVTFRKIGTMGVLMFTFTGVSNTTAMTMTGLPAYAQPATQQNVTCNILNGSNQILGIAALVPGSGTITFSANIVVGSQVQFSSAGFTASGNKGGNATCLVYSLL